MIWEDITLDVAIVFHSFCSTVSRHMMKEYCTSWIKDFGQIMSQIKVFYCQITPIYFTHVSADGEASRGRVIMK